MTTSEDLDEVWSRVKEHQNACCDSGGLTVKIMFKQSIMLEKTKVDVLHRYSIISMKS